MSDASSASGSRPEGGDSGSTEPMPSAPRSSRATGSGGGAHAEPGAGPRGEASQELPVDASPGARRPEASSDRAGGEGRRLPDPVEAVQRPDNRARLLLAIAAMSLLSLLLLVWVLAELLGSDFQRVTVDGDACVIEIGAEEEGVLYCQR